MSAPCVPRTKRVEVALDGPPSTAHLGTLTAVLLVVAVVYQAV